MKKAVEEGDLEKGDRPRVVSWPFSTPLMNRRKLWSLTFRQQPCQEYCSHTLEEKEVPRKKTKCCISVLTKEYPRGNVQKNMRMLLSKQLDYLYE